jgi:hypothetical protein
MSKTPKKKVFLENPYDLETILESMSLASDSDKTLVFLDKLIAGIRLDPLVEISTLSYKILQQLNIIKLQKKQKQE